MELFCYRLRLVEKYHNRDNWNASVQDAMSEHVTFLEKAIRDGTALIVSRTETEPKDNFGLVIFQSTHLDAARIFAQQDPAVVHGVMMADTYPFKLYHVSEQALKYQLWK